MPSPGARLRAAWADQPIMIPGAFNALTAPKSELASFAIGAYDLPSTVTAYAGSTHMKYGLSDTFVPLKVRLIAR